MFLHRTQYHDDPMCPPARILFEQCALFVIVSVDNGALKHADSWPLRHSGVSTLHRITQSLSHRTAEPRTRLSFRLYRSAAISNSSLYNLIKHTQWLWEFVTAVFRFPHCIQREQCAE